MLIYYQKDFLSWSENLRDWKLHFQVGPDFYGIFGADADIDIRE